MPLSVVVESPEIARAFANAVAFMPAASRIKHGFVEFTMNRVQVAGTDGYAAGLETVSAREAKGMDRFSRFGYLVEKEGLEALDKAARAAKKSVGILEITHTLSGDLLTFQGGEDDPVTVQTFRNDHFEDVYDNLLGIINDTEFKRPAAIPGVICFDPALLSRFAKVKADKGDRMADFYMTEGPLGPALVKIGPSFKGLVMPIERERHAKNVGPEGLW